MLIGFVVVIFFISSSAILFLCMAQKERQRHRDRERERMGEMKGGEREKCVIRHVCICV